jgi:hypothetical protein
MSLPRRLSAAVVFVATFLACLQLILFFAAHAMERFSLPDSVASASVLVGAVVSWGVAQAGRGRVLNKSKPAA